MVDYTISRTWENLKVNPQASLSFIDPDTLVGYQINGSVKIIDKCPEYDKILIELREREIDLSTKRIVEGIYRGKGHESFEVTLPERFVVFKIKVEEVVEIGHRGDLKIEKL